MATQTYIDIEGLRIHAHHGALERERHVGNLFEVTLRLYYDATSAMESDYIHDALNYAEVCAMVGEAMAEPSDLIENVVWRIKNALCDEFPTITAGRITLAKIHPPVSIPMQRVAFTLEW